MSSLPSQTTPVYATDEDVAVQAGGDFRLHVSPSVVTSNSLRAQLGFGEAFAEASAASRWQPSDIMVPVVRSLREIIEASP